MTDADEAGVRVQLLGPVRAWRGNDELELGGPQRRALLGMLASRRQVVSRGELIDGLWGHGAPASAADALEELRQATTADRIDILPRLGGHHEVLAELTTLLRAYTAHVARAEGAGGSRAAEHEPRSRGGPSGLPAWPAKALPFLVYD